jgi:hypothetical protein
MRPPAHRSHRAYAPAGIQNEVKKSRDAEGSKLVARNWEVKKIRR